MGLFFFRGKGISPIIANAGWLDYSTYPLLTPAISPASIGAFRALASIESNAVYRNPALRSFRIRDVCPLKTNTVNQNPLTDFDIEFSCRIVFAHFNDVAASDQKVARHPSRESVGCCAPPPTSVLVILVADAHRLARPELDGLLILLDVSSNHNSPSCIAGTCHPHLASRLSTWHAWNRTRPTMPEWDIPTTPNRGLSSFQKLRRKQFTSPCRVYGTRATSAPFNPGDPHSIDLI